MTSRHAYRWAAPLVPAFALVAIVVAFYGLSMRDVPCRRAVQAPRPAGDPMELPIVARPGPVRDLDGAEPGRFRFERDLGAVRMRYEIVPEERRWGLGHAVLVDAHACACDPAGLGVDVPTTSSGVVLRQAPGDVYVLTSGAPMAMAGVPFRSVPAGSRRVWSGLLPIGLATGAALSMIVGLLVARRARAKVERVATWREGAIALSGTVVPAEGGAALFAMPERAHARGRLREGTRVLFSPPAQVAAYRDAEARVQIRAGTRADLARWHVGQRRLAVVFVVVSLAASAASMALALAR